MTTSIRAKYTNGALVPLEPLDLEEGAEIVVSIERPSAGLPRDDSDAVGRNIVTRGQSIYDEKIRHKVEQTERGKFVVIDVFSGDYEIDAHTSAGTWRLLERRPGAITYKVRVGYPSVYNMNRPRKPVR